MTWKNVTTTMTTRRTVLKSTLGGLCLPATLPRAALARGGESGEGATEATPEMRELADIDIAFVPMNLPYTMGVEQAASGVLDFSPAVVYPYHYRGGDGMGDTEAFARLVGEGVPDIRVVLHDWYG